MKTGLTWNAESIIGCLLACLSGGMRIVGMPLDLVVGTLIAGCIVFMLPQTVDIYSIDEDDDGDGGAPA